MATNKDPIFPGAPRSFTKTLAPGAMTGITTNTPTGVLTLGTIPASGAQGAWFRVTPLATNTAAVCCVYKAKSGEAAGTWHLIASVLVSAQTISTTAPPSPVDITKVAGMDFEAGDIIGVGTWATLTASADIDFGFYDLTKPA